MDDDDPSTVDLFTAAVLKVAGRDGLAKVYAIAGGASMSVPICPTEGSLVVRALGMEDARRLCTELRVLDPEGRAIAMPNFYLPRRLGVQIEKRRERVLELRLKGKVKRDIAVELGVTDATVLRDIRILQADGRLPISLPSSRSCARALLAPPKSPCEAVELSDHSANLGEMVPPSDEVP